jgi:hypothetical protein
MTDGARYAARPSDLTGPVACRGQKGKTIRVAIVGAGVMGKDVAITCAAHSKPQSTPSQESSLGFCE